MDSAIFPKPLTPAKIRASDVETHPQLAPKTTPQRGAKTCETAEKLPPETLREIEKLQKTGTNNGLLAPARNPHPTPKSDRKIIGKKYYGPRHRMRYYENLVNTRDHVYILILDSLACEIAAHASTPTTNNGSLADTSTPPKAPAPTVTLADAVHGRVFRDRATATKKCNWFNNLFDGQDFKYQVYRLKLREHNEQLSIDLVDPGLTQAKHQSVPGQERMGFHVWIADKPKFGVDAQIDERTKQYGPPRKNPASEKPDPK